MTIVLGIAYMLVMGAVIVSMTVLLLNGKRTRYNEMYLICQGMVALWCGSQILILLSGSERELAVAYLAGNIGICFVGCSWYYFALFYTGKSKSRMASYIPFAVSCLHYLLILTNGWHHLYYTVFSVEQVSHGIFFYTNVCMTYLFVLTGVVNLYRNLPRENKRAQQLVVGSVLVPVLLNLIYLTGFVKASFDITPLGFGISGILVLLATMKYRFLEVNLTAFDAILSDLEDGVGIFNRNGKLTYSNQSFYRLLDVERTDIWQLRLPEVLRQLSIQRGQEGVYQGARGQSLQIQVYQPTQSSLISERGRHFIFSESNDREPFRVTELSELVPDRPVVFVVKDMSDYYELLRQTRELAITNERLALERERNRIAQQVHDTAGHTLTMIQSCMKLAAISVKKQEYEAVEEYLAQAAGLSSEGIRELRQSINQLRREASYELVTQGIVQLADQVREIPIEVTIQGEDSERYSHLSRVLYDCTRETITNTLKYAHAARMEIIIRFQNAQVELILCDDGKGCDKLRENHGIRGIRDRVEAAGGTVRFLTAEGEGFLTRIQVPISE